MQSPVLNTELADVPVELVLRNRVLLQQPFQPNQINDYNDASKQALTCHIYVIQVNHISTTSVHYQLMRLPLSLCTDKDMALLPHNIHAENVASMSLH